MTRRTKVLISASLAALMVLGTAAVAIAVPMLSLTATRNVVTYPQPTWLKINAADEGAAVGTTVTVQYLPVGATEWKKFRTVAAVRTAEGTVTVPVAPYMLKKTTAFKAVADGLESEVVTVSVKAKLSAPISAREGQVRAPQAPHGARLHLAASQRRLPPRRGEDLEVGRWRLGLQGLGTPQDRAP